MPPFYCTPMTIEDVDWLLRYPSDELVMSQETLNQIEAAISSCKRFTAVKVQRIQQREEPSGRVAMMPHTLADRKLTIIVDYGASLVQVRARGKQLVAIYFAQGTE